MLSLVLVRHALVAAVRDKMIFSLFAAMILSFALSVFLGSTAVVEQDYFAVVFAASGLRFSVVLGLVLFVCFFIRRSFDAKDIEFLLSRPLSRVQFVASYSIAFILLAVLMAAAQGLGLYVLSPHLFGEGTVLWTLSVLADNIIMVGVALFFAMYLSSAATAAMACFAFYALARMMGDILGSLDKGVAMPFLDTVRMMMDAVSLVIPRLDLMAQSSWLIYGVSDTSDYIVVIVQALVFGLFLFLATSLDLVRRQF